MNMNRHNWSTIKGRKLNHLKPKHDINSILLNIEIIIQNHMKECIRNIDTNHITSNTMKGYVKTIN